MKIFVHDEFEPEATAMLQALYSRSAKSVETHTEKVKSRGSSKFMESYYVGYGHASIGDCGTTTVFVELVSLLACKAIQDNPIYSGQETSTRYIDFSKQPIINPVGNAAAKKIITDWIDFYYDAQSAVIADLKKKYPNVDGEKEIVWEKAIAAKAFDVLRGFLPAGVCSQVSWSTNLRQAQDNLLRMETHPLSEVREIAREIRAKLKAKYPASFSHKEYSDQREYMEAASEFSNYISCKGEEKEFLAFTYQTTINNNELEEKFLPIISNRPKYCSLPRMIGLLGNYSLKFCLDFGSFRDLQRHRNGYCPMPILTPDLGFNEWYLTQLPPNIRAKADKLIIENRNAVDSLLADGKVDIYTAQYYYPLGYNVPCHLIYDLPQMVYVAELRAGKTVHPTLRNVAHHMVRALRNESPKVVLHADMDTSDWDVRRGLQDIIEKETPTK